MSALEIALLAARRDSLLAFADCLTQPCALDAVEFGMIVQHGIDIHQVDAVALAKHFNVHRTTIVRWKKCQNPPWKTEIRRLIIGWIGGQVRAMAAELDLRLHQ